jgi:hypothetical protein
MLAAMAVAAGPLALAQTKAPAPEEPAPGKPAIEAANPTPAAGKQKATRAAMTLKGCIAREQADHTGMTMAEARKTCKEQLRSQPSSQ